SSSALFEDIVNAITPGPWTPPDRAAPYLPAIAAAEAREGIPHNMLARLLYQESRYRDDIISGATASSAGALGIAQIVPRWHPGVDPLDPFASIDYAAKYLSSLYRQFGSWQLALAAYNWGPGNLSAKGFDAAPSETRAYVAEITGDIGYA
ncbi:MAG TPA: lytic transglycosylase domain-containing protein, partial [Usitatibacter sp.]|nr:lytic transglycosylase domain-containing protein [Usitatibacter sp.]